MAMGPANRKEVSSYTTSPDLIKDTGRRKDYEKNYKDFLVINYVL